MSSWRTHHRRFRHVQCVLVRNIVHSERAPLTTFFTVHKVGNDEPFFTSSAVENSLNPTFVVNESVDRFSEYANQRCLLCFKVWKATPASAPHNALLFQRTVDLANLLQLPSNKLHQFRLAPNSIVLLIGGSLFSTRRIQDFTDISSSPDVMPDVAAINQAAESKCVTMQCGDTLLACLKSIQGTAKQRFLDHQRKQLAADVVAALKRKAEETSDVRLKANIQLVLQKMSRNLADASWTVDKERAFVELQQSVLVDTPRHTAASRSIMARCQRALATRSRDLATKKEMMHDLQLRMQTRQAKMLSQIQTMYPISVPVSTSQNYYMIRDIRIPTTNVLGEDEESVSSALGYVCHVLILISKYLEVPLRYRIHYRASRSYISDEISPIGSNQYPLYFRGVDKEKFECGVIFLNRIVDQVLKNRNIEVVGMQIRLDNPARLLENLARFFISEVP